MGRDRLTHRAGRALRPGGDRRRHQRPGGGLLLPTGTQGRAHPDRRSARRLRRSRPAHRVHGVERTQADRPRRVAGAGRSGQLQPAGDRHAGSGGRAVREVLPLLRPGPVRRHGHGDLLRRGRVGHEPPHDEGQGRGEDVQGRADGGSGQARPRDPDGFAARLLPRPERRGEEGRAARPELPGLPHRAREGASRRREVPVQRLVGMVVDGDRPVRVPRGLDRGLPRVQGDGAEVDGRAAARDRPRRTRRTGTTGSAATSSRTSSTSPTGTTAWRGRSCGS